MIKSFLTNELDYFKPILGRSEKYSIKELELFRKETVRERKRRVSIELYNLLCGSVKYGPFKNMKLESTTWWSSLDLGSMCLGEYEKELLIELTTSTKGRDNLTFIDIGAADGYYAVGMLFGKYVAKSICFEISEKGRDSIKKNWEKNNSLGQLLIYGDVFEDFDSNTKELDLSHCIILIDIEGLEFDFLSDNRLKIFSGATIFIEIHHWVSNFLSKYENLLMLCDKYFNIDIIQPLQKNTDLFEELREFTDDNRYLIFSESRPSQMRFLKLTPRK